MSSARRLFEISNLGPAPFAHHPRTDGSSGDCEERQNEAVEEQSKHLSAGPRFRSQHPAVLSFKLL